jgi:hypothetical protein
MIEIRNFSNQFWRNFEIFSALDRAMRLLSNALRFIDFMMSFKDIIDVLRSSPLLKRDGFSENLKA